MGLSSSTCPEEKRIYMIEVGGPHTWRIIHMDGRPHPKNLDPSFFGHSAGHWEGDSLVVDTVGFNERFWLTREGIPHTEFLHLTERFTRTDYDTLKYEATVDDPGAYTKPVDRWMADPLAAGSRTVRIPVPGQQQRSQAHVRRPPRVTSTVAGIASENLRGTIEPKASAWRRE